jgi:hypothetical protein
MSKLKKIRIDFYFLNTFASMMSNLQSLVDTRLAMLLCMYLRAVKGRCDMLIIVFLLILNSEKLSDSICLFCFNWKIEKLLMTFSFDCWILKKINFYCLMFCFEIKLCLRILLLLYYDITSMFSKVCVCVYVRIRFVMWWCPVQHI